ncbi:methyltransferase domain-containing protein [Kitasatospora sp. P5_F3]
MREGRRLVLGAMLSAPVRAAMEEVPRHLFVPGRSARAAYEPHPIVVKKGPGGVVCSTTPPGVQAQLAELAAVQPGQRILLAGAAPGITAAVLDTLTGPRGQVVAVERDEELAGRTRLLLAAAGHSRVRVLHADATGQLPFGEAEFDRIVATGSLPGIPSAWWGLLRPGGRLAMPLRWQGHTRLIGLAHEGSRMTADVWLPGDAPPLAWPSAPNGGADLKVRASTDGEVLLYLAPEQFTEAAAAQGTVVGWGHPLWSGVSIPAGQPLDDLTILLAADGAAVGRLRATYDHRRPAPATGRSSPALVDGSRLAYLTRRLHHDAQLAVPRWELGTVGHGPGGSELARDLLALAATWAQTPDHRPNLHLYPDRIPDPILGDGTAVSLTAARLLITPHRTAAPPGPGSEPTPPPSARHIENQEPRKQS